LQTIAGSCHAIASQLYHTSTRCAS